MGVVYVSGAGRVLREGRVGKGSFGGGCGLLGPWDSRGRDFWGLGVEGFGGFVVRGSSFF